MGHVGTCVDNMVGAVLKQKVKISNVFARGATLFDLVVVYTSD